ncbi:Gp37-like protein [Microbacterium halotolerans]|uniref:Gp37-like protein n=1 Tax=Microbacterium halotolerans TaxID=246613 RepID=UPI000E6AA7A4|nr:hypothetical protein [Microbacterium halotolerans]
MKISDLTVEVRDKTLTRVGMIDAIDLPGDVFSPAFRAPGAWQLTLPGDHGLVDTISTPGAGVIVTGPGGTILSGPMTSAVEKRTAEQPAAGWTFTGSTDLVHIADALAVPSPEVEDFAAQTRANDIRTGPAETLLHEYVTANIGPLAPGARRRANLTMGPDLGRGPIVQKSPRFQNLLELLQEITAGTNLWFDIIQTGDQLQFVTGESDDRRYDIRLDLDNEQLSEIEAGLAAPTVTFPVVAGQGEGTGRTIITRSAPAAEDEWGRRIETFADQRQTDDTTELADVAEAALAEGGETTRSLKLVPSDDVAGTYGTDWSVGTWITAVRGDEEIPARVHAAAIAVQTEGVFVGVTIGNDIAVDWESGVDAGLADVSSRVSNLERNVTGLSVRMVDDCDDADEPGLWWVNASAANTPVEDAFVLVVLAGDDRLVQEAVIPADDALVTTSWRRVRRPDGVWGDWYRAGAPLEVTDLDEAVVPGDYWAGSAAVNGPPGSTVLTLRVRQSFVSGLPVIFQEARRAGAESSTLWVRYLSSMSLWTDWEPDGSRLEEVDLSSYIDTGNGFSGTLTGYRLPNGTAEITATLSGDFPSGNSTTNCFSGLPPEFWPVGATRTGLAQRAGYQGFLVVRADGTGGVLQLSGTTWGGVSTSSVVFMT